MKLGSGGLSAVSKVYKSTGQDTAHITFETVKHSESNPSGAQDLDYKILEDDVAIITLRLRTTDKVATRTLEVKRGKTYKCECDPVTGAPTQCSNVKITGGATNFDTTDNDGAFGYVKTNFHFQGTVKAQGGGG